MGGTGEFGVGISVEELATYKARKWHRRQRDMHNRKVAERVFLSLGNKVTVG